MAKDKVLQFRVSEVQRAIIVSNAKREGVLLSDFLLKRALAGEVQVVSQSVPDRDPNPQEAVSAPIPAAPAVNVPGIMPSAYNWSKPELYELKDHGEKWKIVRHIERGGFFLIWGFKQSLRFDSLEQAQAYVEENWSQA
jgi:hypothetical protein